MRKRILLTLVLLAGGCPARLPATGTTVTGGEPPPPPVVVPAALTPSCLPALSYVGERVRLPQDAEPLFDEGWFDELKVGVWVIDGSEPLVRTSLPPGVYIGWLATGPSSYAIGFPDSVVDHLREATGHEPESAVDPDGEEEWVSATWADATLTRAIEVTAIGYDYESIELAWLCGQGPAAPFTIADAAAALPELAVDWIPAPVREALADRRFTRLLAGQIEEYRLVAFTFDADDGWVQALRGRLEASGLVAEATTRFYDGAGDVPFTRFHDDGDATSVELGVEPSGRVIAEVAVLGLD